MDDTLIEQGPGRPAGDVLPAETDLAGRGASKPLITRRTVDLPEPFGPIEAGDLAGGHVKVETTQDVALSVSGDDATQLQAQRPWVVSLLGRRPGRGSF